MSSPLYPPSSPQSVGQVLDAAFRIFQASLLKCLPHGVLSMIAGQLPNIYFLAIGRPFHDFGGGDPLWWTLYALGTLLGLFIWSAMLLRQRSIASQEAVELRTELGEALRRMPAVVGLFTLSLALLAVGIVALILPGLYLTIGLSLSWLILLIERLGPIAAVRRSLHLVRGSWWRTALVLSIAMMSALVFYFVAFLVLGAVLQIIGANDVAMLTAASVIVLVALGAVGAPFLGAVLFAVHGALRLRREGTDLASRLAGVAPA
jgi:hypothetical protein